MIAWHGGEHIEGPLEIRPGRGAYGSASEPALWFIDDPALAAEFGPVVYEVEIDDDGFPVVDWSEEYGDDDPIYDPGPMKALFADHRDSPGVVIEDIQMFEHGGSSTVVLVFDPARVRALREVEMEDV